MPALVIRSGPRAGEKIEISAERSIGRRGADVTIDDSEMSRRHALLRPLATGLEVEDLGSLNGTFVNGARIDAATVVTPADELRLGKTKLAVEIEGIGRTLMSPDEDGGTVVASQPAAVAAGSNGQHAATPPPPAPPPAPAAPAPAPAPGAFQPVARQSSVSIARSRHAATLLPLPTIYSIAIVAATAIAEVVYFAVR